MRRTIVALPLGLIPTKKFSERLVNIQLTNLVTNSIIPQQHGFFKNRSTVTNLMEYAKTYDKLNHSILLPKFNMLNLAQNLLFWLKYLKDRKHFLSYNGKNSKPFIINSLLTNLALRF